MAAQTSRIRRTASIALTALMVVAVVLAIAAFAIPRIAGGTSLTVLSGSMKPTMNPGDMVATRPVDPHELRVGDIITMQPRSGDPTLVTHRIVALQDDPAGRLQITTRGDANTANDPPILAEQVKGRLMYTIPFVGWLAVGAGEWRGAIVLAAAIALIAYGIVRLIVPVRRRHLEGRVA